MSTAIALVLFVCSLVFSALASAVLSHRLDQVGTRLRLSEGALGLITALGADSPEIASAITALAGGHHDLGRSVIFGSNIFNLAMLLGLSAVITGSITCRREALLLNAAVAMSITILISVQLFFNIPPVLVGLLLLLVMLPYVLVSVLKPARLQWSWLPNPAAIWFRNAVRGTEVDTREDIRPSSPTWADIAAIGPLLSVVVVGSVGMVRSATVLGTRWGVSEVVIGALVLATLTGIPNVIAAIRLALQNRGSAVVSETFNSNSLNLIVGVYIPTLLVAPTAFSATARLSLWWLLAMTLLTAGIFIVRDSLSRRSGLLLMIVYASFAFVIMLY